MRKQKQTHEAEWGFILQEVHVERFSASEVCRELCLTINSAILDEPFERLKNGTLRIFGWDSWELESRTRGGCLVPAGPVVASKNGVKASEIPVPSRIAELWLNDEDHSVDFYASWEIDNQSTIGRLKLLGAEWEAEFEDIILLPARGEEHVD